MTRLEQAKIWATEAHEGQFRKFSDTPYIVHPLDVAALVKKYGGDENQQIAAICHDVVEDCDRTIEDVTLLFGADVAYLVTGMTKTYDDDATGAEKSASECARFKLIDDERILLIKIADIYSNLRTIEDTPLSFRKGFIKGKHQLFMVIYPKMDITCALADALYDRLLSLL